VNVGMKEVVEEKDGVGEVENKVRKYSMDIL